MKIVPATLSSNTIEGLSFFETKKIDTCEYVHMKESAKINMVLVKLVICCCIKNYFIAGLMFFFLNDKIYI